MHLSLPQLTIICPVFNEEKVVPLFFERTLKVINELSSSYRVDLLFVNNASTDDTYSEIEKLRMKFSFVYVITLSSNVGYQRSLECGLRNNHGDIMIFIDVDCEDPPEMILDFIKVYEKGYDIVYGERIDREELYAVKMLRKIFYHIARLVADEDFILYMAEFSLITSEVRDAILEDNNSFPFIRSSIARVGFRRVGIPYKRHRRIEGRSHYNLFSMFIFAIAGILSSSTLPLRLPVYLFPVCLIIFFVLGAAQIITGNPWYFLLNGLLVFAYLGSTVAFTALYVARTYKNGLSRSNFIIHRRYSHMQHSE